jgi:hypothetical protein
MKGIRVALAFSAVGLLLALAGVGAAQQRGSTPFYGLIYAGDESWRLVAMNPLTLVQRQGRSLDVGDLIHAWSFSPDRSKLVLAQGDVGDALLLVDPGKMKRLGFVGLGGRANVRATFWPEERRLYAVVTRVTREADGTFSSQPTSLLGIDPETRTVTSERSLDGYVRGTAHGPGILAIMLGAETGIGPARLAVVGADGGIRTVDLAAVQVGSDGFGEDGPAEIAHYAQPGLVVGGTGREAYVVSPGQIAAVDLETLRVSFHPFAAPQRRLQRVEKGALDGTYRFAHWTSAGLLVSGHDDHASVDAKGTVRVEPRTVGLQLVDTASWSARMIDPTASGASIGVDAMLVTPWRWSPKLQRYLGGGATIYSLTGARRAHVFGTRMVFGIAVGRRAFIGRDSSAYSIVSTTTGRILRKVQRPLPEPLVGAAQDIS